MSICRAVCLAAVVLGISAFLAFGCSERSGGTLAGAVLAASPGSFCNIADNPDVDQVTGRDPFTNAWWIRLDNPWVQFTFTGLDPDSIPSENVSVSLNLGVTNHGDGERNLDGLVDIVVNPDDPESILYTDVLLDSEDETNTAEWMDVGGTYQTRGCISVPKTAIIGGELVVRVLRELDRLPGPFAPVGSQVPIDMCTTPPTVPAGVYENDDPHTVHIQVITTDNTRSVAADGEVFLTALKVTPSTYNPDRNGRSITAHTWCPDAVAVEIVAIDGCGDGLPIPGVVKESGVVKFESAAVGDLLPQASDVEIICQVTLADGTVYRSCDSVDLLP